METPTRRRLLGAAALMGLGTINSASAQSFRGGVREAYGARFDAARATAPRRIRENRGPEPGALREWHQVALEATGIDHTPVAAGETRAFGEQLGPLRASRAMAIVHVAMCEALNAIERRYRPYLELGDVPTDAAADAAVACAAHDTLVALFPSQREPLDAALAQDLALVRDLARRARGVELGRRSAAAILALRTGDGAQHREPLIGVDFFPGTAPGQWRQDPVSSVPIALGARWAQVKPFVITAADDYRAPAPPALDSGRYVRAFQEAKRLGGDGVVTPTVRSEAQRQIGIFWAYDGMPSLCAPPRLYNQLAMTVAHVQSTADTMTLARLLALANLAMADAGLAVWESKYFYRFWRPVTGIRDAAGPPLIADPDFLPLGAPVSNLTGPNFTPPFPAYPSAHAAFGSALFEVLRQFYGTDRIAFSFVSDEFNGETTDNEGNIRPRVTRSFTRLSDAENENGRSRVYLGIHWDFDISAGIEQGRRVGRDVFRATLRPA